MQVVENTVDSNSVQPDPIDSEMKESKVETGDLKTEVEPSDSTAKANEEKSEGEAKESDPLQENDEKVEVTQEIKDTDPMDCDEPNQEGNDKQGKINAPKKDPHVGKILERKKILPSGHMYPLQGRVVSYQEPAGRLPPRWSVQWDTTENVTLEDEWMLDDLQPPADAPSTVQGKPPLNKLQERYQQHVEHVLESNHLVSTLLLFAALEEALQTNLQLQQVDPNASSASTKGAKGAHPPLYYQNNPSTYLQAPTATDMTPSLSTAKVHLTPSILAQRVRSGCEWAWNYISAQQPSPPPPPILSDDRIQRRSLRQPKPIIAPTVPMPTPVQKGGRVAMWWLKELENQLKSSAPVKDVQEEVSIQEETPGSEETRETAEVDQDIETESIPESESVKSKSEDDDEDFDAKDVEDEEDEELEGVEKEAALTPVPSPSKASETEEEEDDEEDEEEYENAILYENPYLVPSFPAYLEYLSRPKALSMEEIQAAFCDVILRLRHNKRSAEFGIQTDSLESVDQFVLEQETPDFPSGKVVLECLSGESYAELKKLDPQTFARCKFALDVIGDQESSLQMQRQEELFQREWEFKQQKAWDKWRFRGIYEGYTQWPSWNDSITDWVKENCTPVTASVEQPSSVAQATVQEPNEDEALAKSLEESENASTGRRRTRRAANPGASEGVFYGNQSQLTQKQLMDALIRLVKANQFQTLLGLQGLVGDDSSDPIRRCRTALGKLVWKSNLLNRKSVSTDLSDAKLIKKVAGEPLVLIKKDVGGEAEANAPGPILSEQEKFLVKYIQGLHSTELYLRNLVMKHLSEIPVSIVATAADERINSMEAMDSADFEDQSSMEWLSSGHNLINAMIFRPEQVEGTTDMTECHWFRIRDYCKSINAEAEETVDDPFIVERRMRFRAVAAAPPGADYAYEEGIPLLLTEAQVRAGLRAADLEAKRMEAAKSSSGNPFAGGTGDYIALIPVEGNATEIRGRIVGHDNIVHEDDDYLEFRILILPEGSTSAFWASLDVRADDSSFICQPVADSSVWYSIEHFDYHHGTEAFNECQGIIKYLHRQRDIGAFLEPVDPVALNIPGYFDVVKNPMDLSTVSQKLQNGQYSSIPPGQAIGRSPVARMLNGPFRKDIELIFDNAMLFNPPNDWIHIGAAKLKKNVLKKISDVSHAADQKQSNTGRRERRSVYVDDDSDDMYEYQSDQDDEYGGSRRNKKRKRGGRRPGAKDEYHTRAIENAIRLQVTLRDGSDLRGPFANLPINFDANTFTLSPEWSCRPSSERKEEEETLDAATQKRKQEIAELLALQREVEANESAGLRRSTRTQHETTKRTAAKKFEAEFFMLEGNSDDDTASMIPTNRLEVEVYQERRHEGYYSKLYQEYSNQLSSSDEGLFGLYANGSFPPYLGQVVPVSENAEVSWEIREPFVVPALRWVLRGLINSGHLTALEPMSTNQSQGVLITNDVYYYDAKLQPFEALDLKGLQRRKRANQVEDSESDEDIELSEYEKLRAERVARNAERLKLLGLA